MEPQEQAGNSDASHPEIQEDYGEAASTQISETASTTNIGLSHCMYVKLELCVICLFVTSLNYAWENCYVHN